MSSWEKVQDSRERRTERLAVPGGWLYLVTEKDDLRVLRQMLVFVPAPPESNTGAAVP